MSGYDLFRRRIAPIAFIAALGLIAFDTCNKKQRTRASFELQLGSAAADVRSLEADLWIDSEPVASFRRTALDGMSIGPVRFEGQFPGTDGELRIVLERTDGERKHVTRRVHFSEGATVTVPLERELR